jgi:O-antigen ligase
MMVIPQIIPAHVFFFVYSRLGAMVALLGFLPYFGLSIRTGVVDLSPWPANLYWYNGVRPITSVFLNPNALGFFLLFGVLAAFAHWKHERTRCAGVLLAINTTGLLFTNYRTGWVGLVVAFGVYATYILGGRKLVMLGTLFGLVSIPIFVMIILGMVPGPSTLQSLSLNGRKVRWIASIPAMMERVWFGHGFGNVVGAVQPYTAEMTGSLHNSFLRVFVALGVTGGVVYLLIYIGAIVRSIRRCTSEHDILIPMFLIAFIFVQLFNSLTFVGLSLHSVLISLIIGYGILETGDLSTASQPSRGAGSQGA